MTPLRAVIVEDEPPARARLRRLLAAQADVQVVAEADDVASGASALHVHRPDLVFLDIALGSGSGFDLLTRLQPPCPLIVFTTAYDQHAVRAFEFAAIDYLLKPFDGERLARSLARVRERLAERDLEAADERLRQLRRAVAPTPALERLVVHERGRSRIIAVEDIVRLSAAGNYVEIQTASGCHLIRATLARLAQRLDPQRWLRVHRSHVVRIDFIATTTPSTHGDLRLGLKDGRELMLSRRYRALLPIALT